MTDDYQFLYWWDEEDHQFKLNKAVETLIEHTPLVNDPRLAVAAKAIYDREKVLFETNGEWRGANQRIYLEYAKAVVEQIDAMEVVS